MSELHVFCPQKYLMADVIGDIYWQQASENLCIFIIPILMLCLTPKSENKAPLLLFPKSFVP